MVDLRRCLVETTVITATGGLRLGPGATVDLNMIVGPGVTLRECVDPAWIAPVEPEPSAPMRRRRPPMTQSDARLGVTEETDGD